MRRIRRADTALVAAILVLGGCDPGERAEPTLPTLPSFDAAGINGQQPEVLRAVRLRRSVDAALEATLVAEGVQIVYRFHTIHAVLARVNPTRLARIGALTDVAYVDPDVVQQALGDAVDWTHLAAAHRFSTAAGSPGYAVNVGVLNTGIACWFYEITCVGGASMFPTDPEWYFDEEGHGTQVASVLAAAADGVGMVGAAPGVRLWSFKVLDDNGLGQCSVIAAGIDTAVVAGMDIVNLSLGGPLGCPSQQEVVFAAHTVHGVLVVAAAGNTNGGPVDFPAAYATVAAVSGLTCGRNFLGNCTVSIRWWSGSAQGPEVDISAGADEVLTNSPVFGLSRADGTSFSAPLVSAAAARVISTYPGTIRVPGVVLKHLQTQSYKPVGVAYVPAQYGAGILDAAKAIAVDPCSYLICREFPDP